MPDRTISGRVSVGFRWNADRTAPVEHPVELLHRAWAGLIAEAEGEPTFDAAELELLAGHDLAARLFHAITLRIADVHESVVPKFGLAVVQAWGYWIDGDGWCVTIGHEPWPSEPLLELGGLFA